MAKFLCDVVTPTAILMSDEAYMVVVPGVEGEMGIMAGHAPTVSALADGTLRIQRENGGEFEVYNVRGGYVEVTANKTIVLADECSRA